MIPPVVVIDTCPSSSSCETARSAFPTTQRPGSAAAPEKEDVLVANASCSLRMFLIMPRRRPTRTINKSALAQETSPGQRSTRLTAVPKPLPLRSVLVSVMVPDPGQRTFCTIVISSSGSQFEILVGGVHHVDTSRVARVGVKDRAALVFVEDTDPLPVQSVGTGSGIVVERGSLVGFLGGK